MEILKIVLLVLQLISCVALTVVVTMQNSKESGLGAAYGQSESFLGKGKASTREHMLNSLTKWLAAAFVLLTLFLSLLYSAA